MVRTFASLGLVAWLAMACGGRVSDLTDDGGGTHDGGPPPGSQDGGPTPGFDGGFLDATPPPPPPPQVVHRGYVVLESTLDNRTYASATFFDNAAPECAFMAPASGCSIQTCATNSGQANAGVITIRGGTQEVSLVPGAGPSAQYKPFDMAGLTFPSGSTLTITGAGGVVPGFQGSLVFPAALDVLTPNIAMGQTTIIDSSTDLVVGWNGGTGQTLVYLQSDAGNGSFLSLGCWFDEGAHKAVVPSALLRSFKSQMARAQNTYLLVFPTARSTVVNGGWGVELFAVGQGPIGQASVR